MATLCNTVGPHCLSIINSILTLSTSRQHQIPQVKGSILKDYPPPNFRCQSQVQLLPVFLSFFGCEFGMQELLGWGSKPAPQVLPKPQQW